MSDTPHELINPPELPPPAGYAHAVATHPGRTVYLSGQIAAGPDGRVQGGTLVEQLDRAAANLMTALAAAGGAPHHIVSMQIFVTDMPEYRAHRPQIREVWRTHFSSHYPAMALVAVRELVDPAAQVELMAIAVVT